MKKYIIIAVALMVSIGTTYAKKVKFAVDMTGIPISTSGMHISGDFQTLAGFPGGDWMSDTTPLTQETSDTNIYSIVVDIPAFAKYEYKFVNGHFFYEAEFVPEESRVGHNFNDSRWLYVDSLADDTTFIGALIFAGNAPANLNLVRFYVDMQNQTVSSNGVHLAGDFQSWNTMSSIMYHFDDAPTGLYEVIQYVVPNGTYQYKFYNGNALIDSETISGSCSVGGNRSIQVIDHVMLNTVCFGSCSDCSTGLNDLNSTSMVKIYPNPTVDVAKIEFNNTSSKNIIITDVNGKIVQSYDSFTEPTFEFSKNNLDAGLYFLNVRFADNSMIKEKIILQ